ncbi:NACHT domain-containing protein [Streptomyces sp. NPDC000345]|uniref:NACHT domain-containing protein n=1 Tax=Streptomyces sp. NPDC000345 TaxID=3364537 RepID=UPI0036CF38A5
MAAPPTGPVADFCAELRRLVRACGVLQKDIADSLGLTRPSVSELLGGRRRTPPDWDVVRGIVTLCAQRHGNPRTPPPGVRLDVPWWKSRHDGLVWTVETRPARTGPAPGPAPAPVPPTPELPETTDVFAATAMDASRAVLILAGGDDDLAYSLKKLLLSEADQPHALSVLLDRFPERVRAAHGVWRAALLQAARVVLVSVAVAAVDVHPFVRDGRRTVVNGAARAYGWPARAGDPDGLPPLPADPALREGIDMGRVGPPTDRAVLDTYRALAGPLAEACPEFALSAGLPPDPDGAGGAGEADEERTGLAGLGAMLARFAGRDDLPAAARPLLDGPITTLDVRGPGLPSLADGYVNPRYRLAGPGGEGLQQGAASDKWWQQRPLYEDIERFLAAHLIGLPALLGPLIVLGHPGAGKSLLTKLLTARLPAREFRPLRVELRYTPADADVQTQLEHALRRATGRSESWPDWAEREPGALPVVLLDGFDELLQAGAQRLDSALQWAYLRDVEWFQRREAEAGRPLAVIVTSRTVVAARAEIPAQSQVLRLEPFDAPEIERWLTAWNTTNLAYLERRGLRPLSGDVLVPHHDLAAHPLLLLMLALYDADDNALRRLREENISRTDLYDRLLSTFVRRQIVKDGPLPASGERDATEREMHRLAVVALGMFQRGAQAITGGQAEDDLRALADGGTGDDLLFGRFFFVHEAQAVVAEERLRSYEFMHATFGEHLTARLVERALRRLPSLLPDDGELYALLSFTPLTDRAQIVQNLVDMTAGWPAPERAALPGRLRALFREVPWENAHRTGPAHAPTRQTRAYRDAVYGANLLLIAVLAAGRLHASDFLGPDDLVDRWRRQTLLWQSQLSKESWDVYTSSLRPERVWRTPEDGSGDDVRPDLLLGTRRVPFVQHDLGWPLGFPGTGPTVGPYAVDGGADDDVPNVARRVMFVGDRDAELLLDAAHPLLHRLPSALRVHAAAPGGLLRSAAQTLTALLAHDVYDSSSLPDLYLRCLDIVPALPAAEGELMLEAVCERLVHDADGMTDQDLLTVVGLLNRCLGRVSAGSLRATLSRCVERLLGRGDRALGAEVAALQAQAVQDPLTHPVMLVRLTRAGRTTSFLGQLHRDGSGRLVGVFDACVADPLLPDIAACHPVAVIELLRLAREFGLTDWLAAHTADLLVLLPDNAFPLLRPSDLAALREALPDGGYAYEKEFTEIEESFRPGPPSPGGPRRDAPPP